MGDITNPKQLSTLTLGDQGSSADVLANPRLFVWNAARHLLFTPMTLMTNAKDAKEPYRNSDAWQGTVAISIDTTKGIHEESRITHLDRSGLEAKRAEECKQYTVVDQKPVCQKLIGGGEYCSVPSQGYVPPYCYVSSPIGEYFASQLWNFSNDFVLRNLYLGSNLVTVSNNRLQINDIDSGYIKTGGVVLQ